jgi:hypothetical protein
LFNFSIGLIVISGVNVLNTLTALWAVSGMIAFATYLVRCGRRHEHSLAELVVQFFCATMLGVIALIGIISNRDNHPN